MKAKLLILAGLVFLASLPSLRAQTASDAAAAAGSAATAASAASTQASGLLGLFQAACGALKKCKAKLCSCPLGQMISNLTKPINLATGNLLCGPCCPDINPDDLKKASNTPAGACAKIRQEMAEVPERRASVRCLAYIDCHWYPEAEAALITALRTDRSECVRLEAAVALGSGCCCTRKTIEALTLVVNGSNRDGNPSENSPRVKQAAYLTLQKCVHAYHDETEPQRPEKPLAEGTPEGTPLQLAKASPPTEAQLMAQAVAEARRALAEHRIITTAQGGRPTTGQRSLTQMWQASAQAPPPAVASRRPSPEPPPIEKSEPVLMQTGRRSLFQMWSDSFRKPSPAPPPLPPPHLPAALDRNRY